MADKNQSKKSGGNRKHGRNRGGHQNMQYKSQNKAETNRIKKLKALLKKQPNNKQIIEALKHGKAGKKRI